jgi:phenylacetic acid degradation protein
MTKVYSIDGITPVVDPTAFVHPSAVLIGDVIVGRGAYIGPCASLRGDFGRIIVDAGVNVQDCCVLHSYPGCDMLVEENGHIGHGAVLHGCTVGPNAMVGMNAVVMDGVLIGEASIIAASSFIKAGMEIPPRVLVAGVPGKVVRELTAGEMERKFKGTQIYQELARRSLATMHLTEALTSVEPDRKRFGKT